MKVVIIGGGLAGFSLGVLLQSRGIPFVVCERDPIGFTRGLAFLVHEDAIALVEEFLPKFPKPKFPGNIVNDLVLQYSSGKEIAHKKLGSWHGMKRSDLVDFIKNYIDSNFIKYERVFSHFLYEGEKVIAAVFKNGDIEYGDVFVGADGAKSAVRHALFGETHYTPVEVKEIVGVFKSKESSANTPHLFRKYICKNRSMAFGIIPIASHEWVWFMQYHTVLQGNYSDSPEDIKAFVLESLKDFPEELNTLISQHDFTKSFVWHGTDFDMLPSFHKNNVVLIGDAAHLALPFTSAGTTNAFLDAISIAKYLVPDANLEEVFSAYYQLRAPIVNKHLEFGRNSKVNFLSRKMDDENLHIPLIKDTGSTRVTAALSQKIKLIYFTDPICSTCWIIQPQFRKLMLEYGANLDFEYRMGGLLPSWEEYNKGKIKNAKDAAAYWSELALEKRMPIFSDVWEVNPINSSFPPSLAMKAAQLQDKNKAALFLRRISEMVFFERVNISEQARFLEAAEQCDLNVPLLLKQMNKEAQTAFELDLQFAKEKDIQVLPTFIFYIDDETKIRLKSYQNYEDLERALTTLVPGVVKNIYAKEPRALFATFPSLTTYEVVYLTDWPEEKVLAALNELRSYNIIKVQVHKGQMLWTRNTI